MTRIALTGASVLLVGYVARALQDDSEVVGFDTRPPSDGRPHLDASIFDAVPLASAIDRTSFADNPFAPMFSTGRAEERLGWTARCDHRAALFGA